jgi:Ca2+-binding RTX toxin-like protein
MANIPGTDAGDLLIGTEFDDVLNSDWLGGEDRMLGGAGNDTYNVNSGGDQVVEQAGGGIDTVFSRATTYVLGSHVENLVLSNFLPDDGPRTAFHGIGNALDNALFGNSNDNILLGLDGNDDIRGNSGADILFGGNGDDIVSGGDGADRVYGDAGNDRLSGGEDEDLLFGGDGNDTLSGGTEQDELHGGSGNDELRGGGGADTLFGDAGGDVLNGEMGADTLHGGDGDDLLSGEDEDDSLQGGAGNDQLFGGSENDTLAGDAGDDLLHGGAGLDFLTGGAGRDQFVLDMGGADSADTIVDFNHEDDTIVISPQWAPDGLAGLQWDGGALAGHTLAAVSYFEGVGSSGAGWNDPSGIYVNTHSGEIFYNPTSDFGADSVLLGRVAFSVAPGLDASDFVLGA